MLSRLPKGSMRKPEYMSPSSLKCFEGNRKEYYLRYLADHKPPKFPQTRPMSVGSAFDAYCKSHLHYALCGNYGPDDAYVKDKIFEAQVEPCNRDWAKRAGEWAFKQYQASGALADLMLELSQSVNTPRFEFGIKDFVHGSAGTVPLFGKPDIFFINSQGCRIILDWKVNGFCAGSPTSPYKGYVFVRDSWLPSVRKPSQRNRLPHKDCWPEDFKGIKINKRLPMEQVDDEWGAQLATYLWLLGEEIGSEDIVTGIEQLCGVPTGDEFPLLRCASHRNRVSSDFQYHLHERYVFAWNTIESGHIFTDLPLDESLAVQAELDKMAETLAKGDPDGFEHFCQTLSRG